MTMSRIIFVNPFYQAYRFKLLAGLWAPVAVTRPYSMDLRDWVIARVLAGAVYGHLHRRSGGYSLATALSRDRECWSG